jgi:flagellar biosynthesis/type III secretory pathway protein FliH
MAERIVGRAVALAPETMAEIVAVAIEASHPRDAAAIVRLLPDDLPAVMARHEALARRAPATTEIQLVADESVGRHGCVVETAHGRVDARLETQIEALEQAILRGVGR